MRTKNTAVYAIFATAVLFCAAGCKKAAEVKPPEPADPYQMKFVDGLFNDTDELEALIKNMVRMRTFRDPDPRIKTRDREHTSGVHMMVLKGWLDNEVKRFNDSQRALRLEAFQWWDEVTDKGELRWVFGYRLGSGPRKIAFVAHLDTIPPSRDDPLDGGVYVQARELNGEMTKFIVGRGVLDNKGPAAAGLMMFEALARRFASDPAALKDVTLELVFDTSAETGVSSVARYFEAQGAPEAGIAMDGVWCTVAQKGIERPVFTVPLSRRRNRGKLWIAGLNTAPGPVDQIPDSATLRIEGRRSDLREFAEYAQAQYGLFATEQAGYTAPPIEVWIRKEAVEIVAKVKGAQHSSAPDSNRERGGNPLVALINFAAYLARTEMVAQNSLADLVVFAARTFGVSVFGENLGVLKSEPDLAFRSGNGTTYALTRFYTGKRKAELHLDIRYALSHHGVSRDGKSAGVLTGESMFADIFALAAEGFNRDNQARIAVKTRTAAGPIVYDVNSPAFQSVFAAYKEVTGEECPRHAVGGVSAAAGYPNFLAVGPTFADPGEDWIGPPRNFHGLGEGVPIQELVRSAKIYYRFAVDQVVKTAGGN